MKSWLEKAGKFTVEKIICPSFNIGLQPSAAPCGVLHTTEGSWEGSLGVFKVHFAPHFLVGAGKIAQLAPVGFIGASLVTHNNLARVQIEMVGRSQQKSWLPDEKTLEALASLLAACKAEYSIPLSRPWADGDYGAYERNPHRVSGKFGVIGGWYGHGDVPSPDVHWDPGALRWSELFKRAEGLQHE